MKPMEMLNQIKSVLGVELSTEEIVELAQAKLENGTVLEAESFESGKEVFILTDDDKVALPIGEYEMEACRGLRSGCLRQDRGEVCHNAGHD